MIKIDIGKRIKEIRLARGKTLLSVAEHLGVSEATVQRYESGNIKNLKLDTITNIASYLNVNPCYLMGWEDDNKKEIHSDYYYFPTSISAGLPDNVEGITNAEKISLPDSLLGKWAGNKNIFITKINGDSMNRVMPDGSLIAVKPISSLDEIKDNDIVVFCRDNDYSVKRFESRENELVFRPDSHDTRFLDQRYSFDDGVRILGKVVMWTVKED